MLRQYDMRQIVGWIAVGLSTLVTCIWAFWGVIENFHEGWYFESLLSNLGLMFAQYLSPMLIFLGVTLISINSPRFGAGLHGIIALLGLWFFQPLSSTAIFLIVLPLAGMGALYWFGRPQPRSAAVSLVVGLPLLTLVLAGIAPAIRVSQRLDDGNLQSRFVQGNRVDLVWAPYGPGWPRTGADWHEAQQTCQNLNEDGLTLAPTSQDTWRLPTAEEAVRSMARHGQNSGGAWDPEGVVAIYKMTPDKESPLWNVHSQVIYWWTATEVDEDHAYIIVYDGKAWSRSKHFGAAYLGFRCVKSPPSSGVQNQNLFIMSRRYIDSLFQSQRVFSFLQQCIIMTFQPGTDPAQTSDNLLSPQQILLITLQSPNQGRGFDDIMHVTDLVSELEKFCASANARCMLNLKLFSNLFGQALVIGHFKYQCKDLLAEFRFDFLGSCIGIFDGIVQYGSDNQGHVTNTPDTPQRFGNLDWMIDIG